MTNKVSLIKIEDKKCDWESAIRKGVDLLVKQDIATEELAESIIKNTKELGPYYVLMPQVALAHTSPGSYNKKVGLSLVIFREPISFSKNERHNVNLLFTLSALDSNSHMDVLSKFAQRMSEKGIVEKALNAKSTEEILEIFEGII